jgi:hypothetical protein
MMRRYIWNIRRLFKGNSHDAMPCLYFYKSRDLLQETLGASPCCALHRWDTLRRRMPLRGGGGGWGGGVEVHVKRER